MEYRTLEELTGLADVQDASVRRPSLSKIERLERWAATLERQAGCRLQTLQGTEFGSWAQRRLKRADNSPLTVAYADPILRAEGLKSDRLGDAVDFFGISEEEAHRIFCYCYFGASMLAEDVASRVRAAAHRLKTRRLPVGALFGVAAAGAVTAVLFLI